ncbi:MAG: molybdopterin molybdenumtransferase MoeA, partial [Bacteroidota bacterium]
MISASEAVQIILENTPLLGTEKVSLIDSLGRTLREDIVADLDLPPFGNSAMDGYAVSSSDLLGAVSGGPLVLEIVGEASAGNVFDGKLRVGETVRIMTGGRIPDGADAVVPIEHVR